MDERGIDNTLKDFQSKNLVSEQQVYQGYDYDFVPPLEPKYECAICLMCQKDPIQTTCGHRFCRQCILTWIRNENRRCPEDNRPLTEQDVFPDNFAKREITSLKVKCPNFKNGCQVILELGAIEEHRKSCEFEMIACPNGCPVAILHQDINEHTSKECLHRVIVCSLCYAQFHLNQQQSHFESCPMVSIPCQHCGENFPRQEHQKHLLNECPKAEILCPFVDIGCEVIIHPEQMQEHLSTHVHKHLRLLSSAHNHLHATLVRMGSASFQESLPSLKGAREGVEKLSLNPQQSVENENAIVERKVSVVDENLLKELFQRNTQLEQRLREQEIKYSSVNKRLSEVETELTFLREQNLMMEGRFCNGVYVWRVEGISNLMAEASHSGHSKLLHSPGFYTGAFGYKLCLRLNIIARTTTSYISLFVHFMQGDYDDTLSWPFNGIITLSLLETSNGGQADHQLTHITETMATNPNLAAFKRPANERNPKGFGFTEFITLEKLNRGFYVINDSLTVKANVTTSE